jgi:hypothetical protein
MCDANDRPERFTWHPLWQDPRQFADDHACLHERGHGVAHGNDGARGFGTNQVRVKPDMLRP